MANNEAEKMITPSLDWKDSRFSEAVALIPESIRNIIEEHRAEGVIAAPNVSAKIYKMVIEYCMKHVAADYGNPRKPDEELKKWDELNKWDEKFIDVDLASLYEIMLAANYLEIEGLMNVAFKKLVNMIKGKSSEQIHQIFNIKKDFSPEEEEEIRRENQKADEWITNFRNNM